MMRTALSDPAYPVLGQILAAHVAGEPVILVASPAGGGKTALAERLAVCSFTRLRERCLVATITHEQSFDLCRRLASCTSLECHLLLRDGVAPPNDLARRQNLRVVRRASEIPDGRCIVVVNTHKAAEIEDVHFDSLIVDEAYQLPHLRFLRLARLADRYVLIGDPGQIQVFFRVGLERWAGDPAGPHVSAPEALLHRLGREGLARFHLPLSRRCPADTVEALQGFYAEPFAAMARSHERAVSFMRPAAGERDAVLERCAGGEASLVMAELPAAITGENDPVVADAIAATARRLIERGAATREEAPIRVRLRSEHIGIVCAHNSQVNAVAGRLHPSLGRATVLTANEFQGLERRVMLAWHPLSGRPDASTFHLEAGRLCVMASRHTHLCLLFARAGIERVLENHVPLGDRPLGVDRDPEHHGRQVHLGLLRHLREANRVVPLQV